jgi:hypothetical protein
MITLSHGFKKPETGDKGAVFFPALEDDIQQMNDHNHNGTNSEKLFSSAVVVVRQAVLSAAWGSVGGGTYSQVVTMPAGMNYDDYHVMFKDTASGDQLFPTVRKTSATTYTVFVNDNSLNLTAVYVS